MSADPLMTPAWKSFCITMAGRLDVISRYERETGELVRYPDQVKPASNDNLSDRGSITPAQAMLRFAYWLTLTHWGRGPGPTDEFMAQARAAFPADARRMDEGWDHRLGSVS